MPAEPKAPERRPLARRIWMFSAAGAALLALAARIQNAIRYPGLADYDGPGHALNVISLYQGSLPSPTSWSGFHPPLYHAVSALMWHVLPQSIPVHIGMRFLSLAAGFGAVFVAWRALRRVTDEIDAAIIAALVLGAPAFAIATSMLGNETACVLFVTLLYARLLDLPEEPRALWRHVLVSAAIGTLAMLSKSTGWVAVGLAAFAYLAHGLLHGRRDLRRALATAFVVGAIPLLIAGPFYLRVGIAGGGSPLSFISGAALSPDLALVMSKQPPGERILQDYLNIPLATFTFPRYDQGGLMHSVPGLLYATIWADGQGQFVFMKEILFPVAKALTISGLVPTLLALLGGVVLLRRRRLGEIACLALGAVLLLSLLRYSWIFPRFSAVKASYLLPALLPAALALSAGMQVLPSVPRSLVRALLILVSLTGTGFTVFGWWLLFE